jgi:hypothetical protein
MEKIDIFNFRTRIEKGVKSEIPNIDLITNTLFSKGLVRKEYGLCAEPFDKCFCFCDIDYRGVSCVKNPLSTTQINITVNHNTSTRKKRIYYYSIDIFYIDGFYYLCCLAQSSFYKSSIGAKHTVYKAKENEISMIINEIFNDIEV